MDDVEGMPDKFNRLSADAGEEPPQDSDAAAANSAMAVSGKFKRIGDMLKVSKISFETRFVSMA